MVKKNPDSKLNTFLQEEKKFLEDLEAIDLGKNWERFQRSVHSAPERDTAYRFSQNHRFLLRIAAAIVAIMAFSATLYIITGIPSHHMIQACAEPSHMGITLSEGTQIALNQRAVLSYPERLNRRNRTVYLKGEAFFDVSKVKNSRFSVEVGAMTVQVTGTAFNIREDHSGNIEVSVVEGEVLFYENGKRDNNIRIAAGQKSTYQVDMGQFDNEPFASENFLFWKTETLAYKDTPLWLVFDELEKNYNRTIVVKDSQILQNRWNSLHSGQQLDEIMEELCIYFDLECIEQNDTILVQRKHL